MALVYSPPLSPWLAWTFCGLADAVRTVWSIGVTLILLVVSTDIKHWPTTAQVAADPRTPQGRDKI